MKKISSFFVLYAFFVPTASFAMEQSEQQVTTLAKKTAVLKLIVAQKQQRTTTFSPRAILTAIFKQMTPPNHPENATTKSEVVAQLLRD